MILLSRQYGKVSAGWGHSRDCHEVFEGEVPWSFVSFRGNLKFEPVCPPDLASSMEITQIQFN